MEQVLRGDGQAKVALCECGKLHVTYGPITLHFNREEFLSFADSIGRLGLQVRQAAKDSMHARSAVPNANVCH